ncbi:MAG: VWA domain-containing protein [Candidatus Sumerlaeota bacterium]|nr:VWA domain-containing protein [Candidatus Sumerlaeota bacterium]
MNVPWTDVRFLHPLYFALLPVVAGLAAWRFRSRRTARGAVRFSDLKHIRALRPTLMLRLRPVVHALRLAALGFFIVAMARPQLGWRERSINEYGVDIMIALDISGSMQLQDFNPNRLEAAKRVTCQFLDGRKTDRIGVVIFGDAAFTLCPLTLDYGVIKDFIGRLTYDRLGEQHTALGLGLATAVNRLKDSDAKSKVIILVTDGVDTIGTIDPLDSANLAKSFKIRVYTIGVGSTGRTLARIPGGFFGPMFGVQQAEFDPKTLQAIAERTGGKYYNATDNKSLKDIYDDIDRLEKTKEQYTEYDHYDEKMEWLLIPGLIWLALEILLGNTVFLRLP